MGGTGQGKDDDPRSDLRLAKRDQRPRGAWGSRHDACEAGRSRRRLCAAGFGLFPTMTVRGHLEFALRIRRTAAAAINDRVVELAGLLGIEPFAERRVRHLSGGEAQRVALGRALSFRPRVLLLDEPLNALDEATRDRLCELLAKVQKQSGVTTLHITHSRRGAASGRQARGTDGGTAARTAAGGPGSHPAAVRAGAAITDRHPASAGCREPLAMKLRVRYTAQLRTAAGRGPPTKSNCPRGQQLEELLSTWRAPGRRCGAALADERRRVPRSLLIVVNDAAASPRTPLNGASPRRHVTPHAPHRRRLTDFRSVRPPIRSPTPTSHLTSH
jgi:hypothetical protein